MKRFLEPILEDILKWSLILVVISFVLTMISIILTIDLSLDSNSQMRIFFLAMSNFLFYLGSIVITIGLLLAFFKRPPSKKGQTSIEPKFNPTYRSRKLKASVTSQKAVETESSPLFSPREKKFILSGAINIAFAILIWTIYLVINSII